MKSPAGSNVPEVSTILFDSSTILFSTTAGFKQMYSREVSYIFWDTLKINFPYSELRHKIFIKSLIRFQMRGDFSF